jgi:CubicO group peptidase (beta-lactamase class C family)
VGEFFGGRYAGTAFWVDPKDQLVPVYMSQEPNGSIFSDLAYQSLVE